MGDGEAARDSGGSGSESEGESESAGERAKGRDNQSKSSGDPWAGLLALAWGNWRPRLVHPR